MVDIAVVPVGHGPLKVIAVHGWMAGRRLFDPVHAHLNLDDFSYAFMDCRGYGDQIDSPGPFTVRTIAEDVVQLADSLGWEQFTVLGHSMAGMSAQWLVHLVPNRIKSIVLLSTVPASGAVITSERRALLELAIADPYARRTLIDINTGQRRSVSWLNQTLAISLETTSPESLRSYLLSWTQDDLTPELQRSTKPLMVIVGQADPGATMEVMLQNVLPLYVNGHSLMLDGVGHYAMSEDPVALVRAMEKFISEQATPAVP